MSDHLEEGLHSGVPMLDYIKDPCPQPSLSASTIRRLCEQSPLVAKAHHPRFDGKVTWSRAADVGSAAHAYALEGSDIIQVVAEAENAKGEKVTPTNWRLADAKAKRDKIRDAGKIPLLKHETAPVYEMARIAGEAIQDAAGEGEAEVTIIWREGDVWCRARSDWLARDRGKPVIDYKTTKKSANPREWIRRTLYGDGYDISAAWYLRGLAALGEGRPEYRFLVQEQDAPHDFGWVGLETGCEALDTIDPWIEKAVDVWGACLRSGKWPGYPKHVHYPDAATWRAMQVEESIMAEELAAEGVWR